MTRDSGRAMANRLIQNRGRILAAVWLLAVIVVSVQASLHQTNNFLTFRTSWFNLVEGQDLYGLNPEHQDYFKYSPTFALLFAPLAVLPFWVGVLLWNGANAFALYWGLGRVLAPDQAFVARLLVLLDTIGSMQNVQSNALVAGLMIIGCGELERRREVRAAWAIGLATAIKLFPIIAAPYALLRPYRVPRFAMWSIGVGALLVAAPLLVVSPTQLADLYRSWGELSRADSVDRAYSVMQQIHFWFGVDWPNWPVQLIGLAVLLAPLIRLSSWGIDRFRLLFLASVLMFCVLFNHKGESPTFVVAIAGVAIWFAVAPATRLTWITLTLVIVGTILSSSDAMPKAIQNGLFEPYRLKVLPVLFVWLLTQRELWRREVSGPAGPSAMGITAPGIS
jgi:hypothetical protein